MPVSQFDQIVTRVLAQWEEMCDTCTDTPENLREEITAALREAVAQEYERLYMKLVMRISADIAGDFDLALDQLEYNAAARAIAQERAALREMVTSVRSMIGFETVRKWDEALDQIELRLDAREKSE